MKTYICFKRVRAAKITGVTVDNIEGVVRLSLQGDGKARLDRRWLEGKNVQVGGYFVEYEDGYTSYSPKDVFEAGYYLDDYKGRMQREVLELKERIDKLSAFVNGHTDKFKALTGCEQFVMLEQLNAMHRYLGALSARAVDAQ